MHLINLSKAPTGTNPAQEGVTIIEKFTTWTTDIGWAIGVLCIIIGAIMFMIPSEQVSAKAKKVIVSILIGVAILLIGPAVIQSIRMS